MKQTSIKAFESLTKEYKDHCYVRIAKTLDRMKAGGNSWEISQKGGIEYDRVWRRISEMGKAGIVYRLPTTRPTGSGRQAHVWQLKSDWGKKLGKQLNKTA